MSNLMSQLYIGYVTEIIYKDGKPTLELRVRVPSIHGANTPATNLPIAKPMHMPGVYVDSESFVEFVSSLNKVYVVFESGDYNKPTYLGIKGNSDIYDIPIDFAENHNYNSITLKPDSGLTQATVTQPGRMFYDIEKHTISFIGDLGNKHEIGQNLEWVGKNSNSVLYEGQVVSFEKAQGANKLMVKANASVPAQSRLIGVITTQAEHNQFTMVTIFGEVEVPDFSKILEDGSASYNAIEAALVSGSVNLYLSATVSGTYSLTKPDSPNISIWVASVLTFNKHSGKGRIFVFPHYFPSGSSTGVTDHNDLSGRDANNAHPISAIEGLTSALANATEIELSNNPTNPTNMDIKVWFKIIGEVVI